MSHETPLMRGPRRVWYDAPEPHNRRRALELYAGKLYDRRRSSPGDVWLPPREVASGMSVEAAEQVARSLGLVAEVANAA